MKEDDFPVNVRNEPNFEQRAFIADARNDENLILAQFHTAVLRFHNAVVDWLTVNEPNDYNGCQKSAPQLFGQAQQLTRWHYQWLVVNDFLKTIAMSGIVDSILLGGPNHYAMRNGEAYMPLEFSVAAYRFGHTMVRAAYDHNRNFGRPGNVAPSASFDLLFAFTGNGSQRDRATGKIVLNPFLGGSKVLPFSLGELGSRIVCETIIGQLLNDPESYLRQQGGWDPSKGVRLANPGGDPKKGNLLVTIRDFFSFAGLIA